jgi:hypothetical protein
VAEGMNYVKKWNLRSVLLLYFEYLFWWSRVDWDLNVLEFRNNFLGKLWELID